MKRHHLIIAAGVFVGATVSYCAGRSESGLGEPCRWNIDCASGLCFPAADGGDLTGWTGGACTAACDEQACPPDAACVTLSIGDFCMPGCDADADCREGYVCADGGCLPDCRDGWDCGVLLTCNPDSGRCEMESGVLAGLGEPCDADAGCASGVCFEEGVDAAWAGGSCVAPCTEACANDCVVIEGQAWCVGACDAGCRDGYVCNPGANACLPDCRSGWDCGASFVCGADGVCALNPSLLVELGGACTSDARCASEICFEETDVDGPTGWTGGACVEPCTPGCATRCVVVEEQAWCLAACADGACRDGYVCQPQTGSCLPDCRGGWDCGDQFVCGADGLCALANPALARVGEPCTDDAQCLSGICFEATDGTTDTGWAGGACAAPCTVECASDCVVFDGQPWCLGSCAQAPCRDGYVCDPDPQVCLPDCRLGWDCGTNFACGADGTCALATANLVPNGGPCAADHDCASGICFEATDADGPTGWADGTCAEPCTDACTGGCVVLDAQPWCLPTCDAATPCRTGYVCSADLQVCLPDCRLGWECSANYVCEETGECEPGWTNVADYGAPCASHSECSSGICLLPVTDAAPLWQNGVCTVSCAEGCPAGTVCAPLGSVSYCLVPCADQSDCGAAFVCDPSSNICVPSCELGWDCPDGTSCNMNGLCRRQGGTGPGGGG